MLTAGLLAGVGVAPNVAVAAASSGGHHTQMIFVSPQGTPTNSGKSCATALYTTIQSAVNAAPSRATVVVCKGTYAEDVVVSSPLTLSGRNATIQGTATTAFLCDQLGPNGPGTAPCLAGVTIRSSHVSIEGFTVTGAIGEGILATGTLAGGSVSDVSIKNNRVVGNNLGGIPPSPSSSYPQCAAQGQIPGDCGEGIHLMGVASSVVAGNHVSANEGGILLTDEFGPTHGNLIEDNTITGNPFDCGVTAPGHNPFALDASGNPQPLVAGVYNNVIRGNRITDNGLQGEGAGVLFANAGPGTASYNNLVEGNYIAGNQLSGVTMHAHTLPPGLFEDLNGNRIIHNVIGRNNVGSPAVPGDPLDGPPAQDFLTTGILVFSGTVPVHVTISDNQISNDQYGVWLGINGNVTVSRSGNSFHGVATHFFTFS
ncbi:MAG: right-handed parallel beta-helix repeat-containing protein [Candidatus Dormibacteraeota bacterium]|nr:right-handed parallel beta-helix repeat-containing protein [Candidatus Dormibacteraeota bacterium]